MKIYAWMLSGVCLLQACQNMAPIEKRREASSFNLQLGMAYLKQGDSPRAKRKLLKALALDPNSTAANSALGYYFEKTADMAKAEQFYHRALVLAQDSGEALNNYGTFLCRLGRYRESVIYFQRAVNDVNYINTAAANENAGLCLAAIPDYPAAESYFKKALAQDPHRKQALYELISLGLKQKQPAKALKYLQTYYDPASTRQTLLAFRLRAAHITGETNEHDSNNG